MQFKASALLLLAAAQPVGPACTCDMTEPYCQASGRVYDCTAAPVSCAQGIRDQVGDCCFCLYDAGNCVEQSKLTATAPQACVNACSSGSWADAGEQECSHWQTAGLSTFCSFNVERLCLSLVDECAGARPALTGWEETCLPAAAETAKTDKQQALQDYLRCGRNGPKDSAVVV